MKQLFSPWRSSYIDTFNKKKKSKGCLFCNIARQKNDLKNLIIWRGKKCYVVMNRFPYNSGHLMVVPYLHTSKFGDFPKETNIEIMATINKCIKALTKLSKPHGFNLGANLGRTAGAGIESHIHFHIVPRWNGDTNFMPVLNDVKLVSENISEMCIKLTKIMQSIK